MITINQKDLRRALHGLSKIVPRKTTLPVLQFVRVASGSKGIVLEASDLDQHLSCLVSGEADERGSGLIPLGRLKHLVDSAGDTVIINSKDLASDADWPEMHIRMRFRPCEGFLDAFRKATPFVSKEQTRPILNGVLVEPEHLVSTDGRRLLAQEIELPVSEDCTVPASRFLRWSGLKGDAEIGLTSKKGVKWFGLRCGPWRYAVRSIEGKYPNWRQVIPHPDASATRMVLSEADADYFKYILPELPGKEEVTFIRKRGAVVLKGAGVKCDRSNSVVLNDAAWKGNTSYIAVNRHFFMDAIAAGFREFRFEDENSPLKSEDGKGALHLLMPMRVAPPVKRRERKREERPRSKARKPEKSGIFGRLRSVFS